MTSKSGKGGYINAMLQELWNNLTSVDYWLDLLDKFQQLGPVVPIAMAAIESLIPPLPLVAIVLMNVAAHGPFWGFLYSWMGTCIGCTIVFFFYRLLFMRLFVRFSEKHPKILKARQWVEQTSIPTLFLLALLPFTPSAFLNFAFGLSEISPKKYLLTLYGAKLIMIGLLAAIGQSFVLALRNPWTLLIGVGLLIVTYIISRKMANKHIKDK